jgi:hypothetical protein
VLTKKPMSFSISARLRFAMKVPTQKSPCPDQRDRTASMAPRRSMNVVRPPRA